MIQMPPNTNEFQQVVVNTNNEVAVNPISNITSSIGNPSFIRVPISNTTSSSSSSINNLINQSSVFPALIVDTSCNGLNSPYSISGSTSSIENNDELDLNMDDMMRTVISDANIQSSALDDMVFDLDIKSMDPNGTSGLMQPLMVSVEPSVVQMGGSNFVIKQEMGYGVNNNEDNTNSSSFSCGSINDKTNSTTTTSATASSQVTTIVTNRNGKSVVEKRFGPITVRPRRNPAPTLSSGRRSKYIELTPDEEYKREMRRQRNRQAAEKCKQKRNEIETRLEGELRTMTERKKELDRMLDELTAQKRELELRFQRHVSYSGCSSMSPSNGLQFGTTSYPIDSQGYYSSSSSSSSFQNSGNHARSIANSYYPNSQYSTTSMTYQPATTNMTNHQAQTTTNLLFPMQQQSQSSHGNINYTQNNW